MAVHVGRSAKEIHFNFVGATILKTWLLIGKCYFISEMMHCPIANYYISPINFSCL